MWHPRACAFSARHSKNLIRNLLVNERESHDPQGYSSTLNSQFGVGTLHTRDARQAGHRHGVQSSLLRLGEQRRCTVDSSWVADSFDFAYEHDSETSLEKQHIRLSVK